MNHDERPLRNWLKSMATLGLAAFLCTGMLHDLRVNAADQNNGIDIGSRRELFIDDHLIDHLEGAAEQRLHHPVPRQIVMVHDAPWEGTGSGYHSIFQDGDRYRMYYKAWHLEVTEGGLNTGRHPLFCCYAESDDGIVWRKPKLGLHQFQGSDQNNIVITSGKLGSLAVDAGHPAIFKDDNPDAPADARYKAIVRSSKPNGLLPLKSPDGLHFTPMTDAPILGGLGAFDSQNLAFWDPILGKYRAYWRIFTAGEISEKVWKPSGFRAIRTATSDDLVNWSKPVDLTYVDSPQEHLYTNQIKPYSRAPHILLGFPTRYVERGWSASMQALPEPEQRKLRASSVERYGTALTEGLLMASRDGETFKRWNEAFLRPGIERPGTWHYGHQYIAWHPVETKSALPGAANELSLYSVESYWTGKGSAVRRYTLRLDGFVSLSAPMGGGEMVTQPLIFSGAKLAMNFATSAAGSVRVEIQDSSGHPIEGYSLADSPEHFGDSVERVLQWNNGSDVGPLAGQPVRLRFVLKDADLYSFRFLAGDQQQGEPATSSEAWPALPDANGTVTIPAQSSPLHPDARTVKVYLTYPGGALENVNADTGLMLSLHNWGGTGAVGTADPEFLASNYNVIAICVDYLQSGDKDHSLPYDCGYLQALDSLRGLHFVFDGLDQLSRPFARGRIYAAGGSGGGNVGLMANKLAPRTFAGIIDCSGMCKLSDDIAFDLPGGTRLNARYSQDRASPHGLTAAAQELRFVGHPDHLLAMKALGNTCKVIVSHGSTDHICPVEDTREMVANMQTAGIDVEPHFIAEGDLDGKVFKDTGHGVGDRTLIVDHFAHKYLAPDSPTGLVRKGKCDFELGDEKVRYATTGGAYVISYQRGYPVGRFEVIY